MGKSKKTVKISGIKSNAGKLSPILVDFEHGKVDPEAFKNFKAKIKIGLPENQDNENGPQLKLGITSDHMTYSSTAKSLNGYGIRHDPYYSTYIGIRNKEDNTMKLYEIEQMTVAAKVNPPQTTNPVLIEARLEKMKEDKESTDPDPTKKAKEDAARAKKHLVMEFGQHKGQRIYRQADRMAIEAENMTDKLSKAAEKVSKDVISLPNQVLEQLNLAPPCNRKASYVSDIYKIKDILSENELQSLKSSAQQLHEEFDTKEKISEAKKGKDRKFGDMFAHFLGENLRNSDYEKTGIALYMEGIVQFLNMRSQQFEKGPRGMPEMIPMSIRDKIFRVFTDDGRISPESKDRSVCYVLVLALIISPYFVVDLSIVTASIKGVGVPQIKKLITVIGAHLKTDADKRAYIELTKNMASYDPHKRAFKRKN